MADQNDDRAAVVAAALDISKRTGVSARVLIAVALVETGGVPFAAFGGRREPLIRFEGHVFDRLLPPAARAAARAAGLAHPKAGTVRNPASQEARWRLLDRASAIDANAAFAATSWGLGQVMGLHWKALGYRDPPSLAAAARGSIKGQFHLVAAFLRIGDLHRRLERGDVAGFSRGYNGPAYRQNGYDAKIARALSDADRRLAASKPQERPDRTAPATPSPASPGEPSRNSTPSKEQKTAQGWSRKGGGLSAIASWLLNLISTRAATRSFSTSTAPSSAFATIPPPSPSIPQSSTS